MKKLRNLILILVIMLLALPFSVKAEKEETQTEKEPVKVYLFHSTSCGYCKAALAWFESIEKEYGKYFDLVEYEVSSDENSALWQEVATMMGDTPSGVPYMVVGEHSYPNGFASDTVINTETKETMGDQLIDRIMEIYESDNRYDVMYNINNKPSYDGVVTIVAVVIIAGIVAMAVITRRNNN